MASPHKHDGEFQWCNENHALGNRWAAWSAQQAQGSHKAPRSGKSRKVGK